MGAKVLRRMFSLGDGCGANKIFVNHLKSTCQNVIGYVSVSQHSTDVQEIPSSTVVPTKTSLEPTKSNEVKPKKKYVSQSKEILHYLSARDLHPTDLPPKILRRKRSSPEALYIVDKDMARDITNVLKPHIMKGNCPILEVNPGLCFLSEELLAAGVKNLRLYEPSGPFQMHANILKVKNQEHIVLKSHDLLVLYKQAYQDKFDNGGRVESMLSGIPKKRWEDDPAMRIIAALPSVNFIKHLILSFVFQNGIMMCGRPELYLIMPPPLYVHLTCDKTAGYLMYRATTVLYQLIFKTKLLGKLSRKAFLPWDAVESKTIGSKLKKVRDIDPEFLYLVKVEARKNFFDTVTTRDKLQPLWYFTKQNLISRKNRVIPQLEKWIPGCGPRLIQGNMNIFTQFGDLTPYQILSVFNEFSSWPEYQHCTFLPSMESNFIKMDSASDEIDKDLEEEPNEEETEDADDIEAADLKLN